VKSLKTYKKVLFYEEYESPIRYGYKLEHRVKTYIAFTMYFDFKEGLRFTVSVSNAAFCYRNPFKSFIKALEYKGIGMAKYNRLKEDMNRSDLWNKLKI